MSLAEFSSVFSVTFISQLLCASVSGVVADKMGNSKPVLIFHMTVTTIAMVCLLLTPNINNDACEGQSVNFSSFDKFESLTHDSDNCSYICFDNNKTCRQEKIFNDNITRDNDNATISYPLLKVFIQNKSDEELIPLFFSFNVSAHNNLPKNFTFLCFNSWTKCPRTKKILVILYAFFAFSFLTFWSTAHRLMDVITMSLVKEHGSSFEHERIFAMISETTVSIMVSFGMDLFDSYTISQNKYDIVYWTCAVLMTLAVITTCSIKAKIDPPCKQLTAKALKIVKNMDIFVFLVVMFIAGSVHCFYWNFNLWLLDDLNAQKIILGLNNACFTLCAIPGLMTFKWWLEKLGTRGIFLATFFYYAINGFGFLLNNSS